MIIADLIFPKNIYCISCGRPMPLSGSVDDLSICDRCASEIDWISNRRRISAEGRGHFYGNAFACAVYSGQAAEIVRDMKYRGKSWNANTLAALMAVRYFAEADPETGELPYYDYIVHVPMHASKKALRGYDQAELLAAGFARRIGVPHLKKALTRTRKTETMSGLSKDERLENLLGAFAVSCDIMDVVKGMRLLLIDDVYTTGSSVSACTESLLAAGAGHVDVFVFAAGGDERCGEDRPAVVESPGRLRAKGPT